MTTNNSPAPTSEYRVWKHRRVAEGIRAAERGAFVPHDQLFRELRRRYATPGESDLR